MSQITTHVLDTSRGCPAAGIPITLSVWQENNWALLNSGITNADGRISDLLTHDTILPAGRYKMCFVLEKYFHDTQQAIFYPLADVVFDIPGDGQHYHIPLLLSPYGYSTYRGS